MHIGGFFLRIESDCLSAVFSANIALSPFSRAGFRPIYTMEPYDAAAALQSALRHFRVRQQYVKDMRCLNH